MTRGQLSVPAEVIQALFLAASVILAALSGSPVAASFLRLLIVG